jgi:RNA polymerase sigma factor (sigma-70 family)
VTDRRIGLVLRSLAAARPAPTDAELLGRFAAGRDRDAFAALVERHGRLVWAVCRHLAGPDADDAFQATFLVLLRNAGRIRNPGSLPAWLHGVAYRVSAKARRAAALRAARERAAADRERAAAAVPDSAWDRALAAVHEEVARLPDNLRVPFVLCALEGRTVTEAATRLGWKVTTLSARLGRAKAALLARMETRGLTAGAVVALAIAAEAVPPAAARAAAAVGGGGSVSGQIQILTKGVVGMSAHSWKLMAAGVLVALGLGVGGGAGWLGTAGAQPAPGAGPTPEEKVRQLEAQLDRAKRELEEERAADRRRAADEVARLATARWQYAFVPVRDLDAEAFVQLLREREAGGWDYGGQATLKKEAVWVFRRPVGGQVHNYDNWANKLGENLGPPVPRNYGRASSLRPGEGPADKAPPSPQPGPSYPKPKGN